MNHVITLSFYPSPNGGSQWAVILNGQAHEPATEDAEEAKAQFRALASKLPKATRRAFNGHVGSVHSL